MTRNVLRPAFWRGLSGKVLVIDGEESCADQEAGGQIKRCGALLLQPLLDDGIGVAISERFWF